jgi:hypothetical protein
MGTLQDNIKIGPKEKRSEDVDWVPLAPDRVQWRASANTVMTFRVS